MAGIHTIFADMPLSSNKVKIRLNNCGFPVLLGDIDEIILEFACGNIVGSSQNPGVITWDKDPHKEPGVFNLFLGKLGENTFLREGNTYYCHVKVYTRFYPEGLFWGSLRIIAI